MRYIMKVISAAILLALILMDADVRIIAVIVMLGRYWSLEDYGTPTIPALLQSVKSSARFKHCILYHIHYLIVTKSDLVASDEYMKILEPELAHIQITVTSTDDIKAQSYEYASTPTRRNHAIETLYSAGFDTQLRLSPFIPENICFETLNRTKCNKIIVEFLRVNRRF